MKQPVVRNTFFLSIANLLSRGIGFFYFVFLARILGVDQFGHYNFAIALVYNFYPVADFGVERLILRDLSKDAQKAQDYFQKIIPLRFILALISVFLVTLIGFFLSKSNFDRLNIFIFSLCLFPWTFNQLVAGIGNALERMEIQSLAIVLMSLLTAVFGGLVAFLGGSVPQILLAALFSNLIVSFIMVNQSGKLGLNFVIKWDSDFGKKVLAQSWVFASIMIMAVFYLRMSIVMVNFFKGAYYTGLYSSVFKFIEASILIPQSLALALFPQMARLLQKNRKKLAQNYFFSLIIILLMSLPFFIIFYFFPGEVIKIAYGSKYLEAIPAAKILAFSFILFFLNTLPGNVIQSSNKVLKFLPLAFLNLLFMVLACFCFISKYSIEGAAWAVLLAEAFGFIINNTFVFKILSEKD